MHTLPIRSAQLVTVESVQRQAWRVGLGLDRPRLSSQLCTAVLGWKYFPPESQCPSRCNGNYKSIYQV